MAGLHNAIIQYKNNAISEMLRDTELVKAIDPHVQDASQLVYKNIFPYFRVPTADTETLTYITVCIDYPETYERQQYIREIVLKICVIVHQDQMTTDYGATKLDYISARIDDIFNDSLKYGHGRLKLLSSTESSLDQFHRYREMMWTGNEAASGC